MQKVKFPFDLDMSPLCTLDLQEKLSPAKLKLKEISDRKADEKVRNISIIPLICLFVKYRKLKKVVRILLL